MAQSARHRWIIAAPLGLVLALLLLWSGYWYVALTGAKAGFSQFERELAARGGALTCNEEAWGGFPFRVSLGCARLVLRLSGRGATFETVKVEALAQAYALGDVIAIAQGPSRLSLDDGETWDLEHAPLTASFQARADRSAEVALEIEDTTLRSGDTVVAKGKRLEFHARNQGPQAVEFAGLGEGIMMAPVAGAELDVSTIDFQGTIDNLPPGFATMPSDLLTAAAISGARVSLKSLNAIVDGSTVTGSGAVALGADGFPDGGIAMRLTQLDKLLASLQGKGLIDKSAAAAGTLLLGLLLGKKEAAPLDLTFRQGRVYWGPFKLLEHGPIR